MVKHAEEEGKSIFGESTEFSWRAGSPDLEGTDGIG
jgi:hypothetical protein